MVLGMQKSLVSVGKSSIHSDEGNPPRFLKLHDPLVNSSVLAGHGRHLILESFWRAFPMSYVQAICTHMYHPK